MKSLLSLLTLLISASAAVAEAPEVIVVETSRAGMGWRFDVTLKHPDKNWDHYADGWEIVDEAGHQLGFRELMHPHIDEQPFTRSLRGIMLPDGVKRVWIRARCSQAGWASERYEVNLSY